MPLSDEQRRLLDIHIRSNTVYDWHVSGMHGDSVRTYIIDSVERVVYCKRCIVRDLFLPNSFINGCDAGRFWFRIAAIASGCEEFGWHELEYGPAISRDDPRQRYVFTWTLKGEAFRFYTKRLVDNDGKELVWYVGKGAPIEDDIDSGDETDKEEIILWSHTPAHPYVVV